LSLNKSPRNKRKGIRENRNAPLFTLFLFFWLSPISAEVSSTFWNTEKTQHFIIYYQDADIGFIRGLSNAAEKNYNSIVDELGFRRMNFWSWDNRAKIYIYPNAQEYHKETKKESWSNAVVFVYNRTIKSFMGQAGFFDSILPHEMTHIIFREFVGANIILPLWIDEGVASSQEKSNLVGRLKFAKGLIQHGKYIDFDKFSQIYRIIDVQPQAFYAQSASMIVFLIRHYGKERFVDFSRRLRDGTPWDAALFSVYRLKDLSEMESAWKDFILRNF
jgi:hypothetical protein